MQLLSKPQINIQKVAERRQEIEQGAILARKIDKLRQDYVDEEMKLTKFRDETTTLVLAEIENLTKKVHSLKDLCSNLEERRQKLLEPLDKEWKLLEEERTKINKISHENDQKTSENAEKEAENGRIRETLDGVEERLRERDTESKNRFDDAIELHATRKQESAEFTHIRDIQEKDLAKRIAKVSQREMQVQINTDANRILKNKNLKKEYDLGLKERALNIREYAKNNRPK